MGILTTISLVEVFKTGTEEELTASIFSIGDEEKKEISHALLM